MVRVAGVRFKKACKVYDFEADSLELSPGDTVIVEVERGLGMGSVVYTPREVDPATLTRPLKKIVRKADPNDIDRLGFNTEREGEAFRICKEKIIKYNLPMKLIRVEYLFDSSKAIFYFTSDMRVDFRELVKDLAATFHTRIEMRQIGVRDEAKMIGGLGPCGRELCCSGFLADFEPVTIKMAKDQNLALNPVKISGICGRLMCCLSYEHDFYQNERKKAREREKELAAQQAAAGGAPPQEAQPEKKERDASRGGRDRGRDRKDRGRPGAGQHKDASCGGCGHHGQGHGQQQGEGGRQERQGRPERADRQGRPERPDRQGRPERPERKDRGGRPEKGQRQSRPGQPRPAQAGQNAAGPEQEAPRQEAPRQEAPRQEAPRQEAPRQEAPRQEAPRQEAPAKPDVSGQGE